MDPARSLPQSKMLDNHDRKRQHESIEGKESSSIASEMDSKKKKVDKDALGQKLRGGNEPVADHTEQVGTLSESSETGKSPPVDTVVEALSGTVDLARQQFPEQLLTLLEGKTCPEALYWLPNGDRFAVAPENFAKQVLEPFFQGTKFESFTRKLNRWGYRRVISSEVPEGTLVYYHPDFRTGNVDQVKNMRSGGRHKRRSEPYQAEEKTQARVDFRPPPDQPSLELNRIGNLAQLPFSAAQLPQNLGVDAASVRNEQLRALLAAHQPQLNPAAHVHHQSGQESVLQRAILEQQLRAAQLRVDQLVGERALANRLFGGGGNIGNQLLSGLQNPGNLVGSSGLGLSGSLGGLPPPVPGSLLDRSSLLSHESLTGRPSQQPDLQGGISNSDIIQLLLLEERRKQEERNRLGR